MHDVHIYVGLAGFVEHFSALPRSPETIFQVFFHKLRKQC